MKNIVVVGSLGLLKKMASEFVNCITENSYISSRFLYAHFHEILVMDKIKNKHFIIIIIIWASPLFLSTHMNLKIIFLHNI